MFHHLRQMAVVCLLLATLVLSVGCGEGVKLKDVTWKEEKTEYFKQLMKAEKGYVGVDLFETSKTPHLLVGLRIVNNTNNRLVIRPSDFKLLTKDGELMDISLIEEVGWKETQKRISIYGEETYVTLYYKGYTFYDSNARAVIEPGEDFPMVFCAGVSLKDVKYISFDNGTYRAVAKAR